MTKDTAFGNNGDSSLSSKHIRFDDKSDTKNDTLPSNKKRKNKKRKRNANNTDTATTNETKTSSCDKQLFNGLILAISTLEAKQTNTTSSSTTTTIKDVSSINNKTLKQTLQSHGATISPQVHKKVHYLIATDSAIQNLTQRVRQAYKRNVDIVNVNWIDECIKKNTTKKCTRVDVEAYLCNELVKTLIDEKELEKKKQKTFDGGDDGNTSDIPTEDNNGWSTPIELDCCCVCHENGDDNCPWCTGPENTCNLTLARLARKQQCTKVS